MKSIALAMRFTTAQASLMYPEVRAAMLAMIRTTVARNAQTECGERIHSDDVEIEERTFIVDTLPDEDDDPETFVSEPIEVTEFIATAYLTGAPRA